MPTSSLSRASLYDDHPHVTGPSLGGRWPRRSLWAYGLLALLLLSLALVGSLHEGTLADLFAGGDRADEPTRRGMRQLAALQMRFKQTREMEESEPQLAHDLAQPTKQQQQLESGSSSPTRVASPPTISPPRASISPPVATSAIGDSLTDPRIRLDAVPGLSCDLPLSEPSSCVWSSTPGAPTSCAHIAHVLHEAVGEDHRPYMPFPRLNRRHVRLNAREELLFHYFGSSHRNLEDVIAYFAPTFKFDSREHYYPVNMTHYISHCALAYGDVRVLPAGSVSAEQLVSCHWNTPGPSPSPPPSGDHDWRPENHYGDVRHKTSDCARTPFSLHCPWTEEFLRGNLDHSQHLDEVPLYAHTRFNAAHDTMEIIYVATYAFNGPYSVGLWNTGEHQSDQEHLTVYVDLDTWTIKRVWTCTHGYRDGRWTSWGDLEWEDTHSAGEDSANGDVPQIPPPAVQFDERGVPVFPLPPPPRRFLTYVGMYYHGHNPHPSISDDFERENGRGVVWRPRKVVPLMQQPYWAHHQTQWAYFTGALGIGATNAPGHQQWWEEEPEFHVTNKQRVGFLALCVTVGLLLTVPFVAIRWAWRRTQRTAAVAHDCTFRPSSPLPSIWTSPSRSLKLLRHIDLSWSSVSPVLFPPLSCPLLMRRLLLFLMIVWALMALWLVAFLWFFFATHSWVAVGDMAWDYLRYITRRR